jgi:hypothetical protein
LIDSSKAARWASPSKRTLAWGLMPVRNKSSSA